MKFLKKFNFWAVSYPVFVGWLGKESETAWKIPFYSFPEPENTAKFSWTDLRNFDLFHIESWEKFG